MLGALDSVGGSLPQALRSVCPLIRLWRVTQNSATLLRFLLLLFCFFIFPSFSVSLSLEINLQFTAAVQQTLHKHSAAANK